MAVDAVVLTKLMEEQGRLDCNALLKEMSLLLGGGPFPGSVQDRRARVLAGEKTDYVRYVGPSEQRVRIIENILATRGDVKRFRGGLVFKAHTLVQGYLVHKNAHPLGPP